VSRLNDGRTKSDSTVGKRNSERVPQRLYNMNTKKEVERSGRRENTVAWKIETEGGIHTAPVRNVTAWVGTGDPATHVGAGPSLEVDGAHAKKRRKPDGATSKHLGPSE